MARLIYPGAHRNNGGTIDPPLCYLAEKLVRNTFSFMPGPFMYLYVRSFKEKVTVKKTLPYILLFIVLCIFFYKYTSYLANKYPGAVTVPEEALRSIIPLFIFIARYGILFTFYFISRRELNLYQRSIKYLFSETSRIDMNWVRWLINGHLVIVICSAAIYFLMVKFIDQFYLMYLINIAIATPYIYGISYKGLTQPTIWQKAKKPACYHRQRGNDPQNKQNF